MKMQSTVNDQTIEVIEHIILKNFWEVYVIEIDGDQIFNLTVGHETELGYSSLEELKPFIISRTKNLNEVMPAPSWKWVEDSEEVTQFIEQLKAHDWTYTYSDDHRAYTKGEAERKALYAAKERLEEGGMSSEETVALWNQHTQPMFHIGA